MTAARQRDLKRRLTSLADEYGATVKLSMTGGGHIRARFAVGARKADVYLSSTPSDRYAGRRNAALVQRMLRAVAGAPRS